MSIDANFSNETPPSKIRVWKISIDNGVNETRTLARKEGSNWIENPVAVVLLRGCDPILDGEGNPALNEFGQPMYKDSNLVAQINLTSLAELQPFMESVWEPLMGGAYDVAEANLSNLRWAKLSE